jgi:hypothetical protein
MPWEPLAGFGMNPSGLLRVALIMLMLASCGGSSAPKPRHDPRASIPPASPVAMTQTPRTELSRCRTNSLLRPVCPRRIPAWNSAGDQGSREFECYDGHGHQVPLNVPRPVQERYFARTRCVFAEWGYEVGAPLPGLTAGRHVSAWDGTEWFVPAYAQMVAPPWHVHIDIQASVGTPPIGGGFAWPDGGHSATDALLNPSRHQAVSLGWARWYGHDGQLVLAPTNVNGGLWAGHLVFYFAVDDVRYAITLHAWASKLRISGGGVTQMVSSQSGPALPHIIATLKDIVRSALGRQ